MPVKQVPLQVAFSLANIIAMRTCELWVFTAFILSVLSHAAVMSIAPAAIGA